MEWFAVGAYGLASAVFLLLVARGGKGSPAETRLATAARLALVGAFVVHAGDIGLRCVHGIHPFAGVGEVFSLASWLLAGGYLALTLRHRLSVVGSLVAPASLVLLLLARVAPSATGDVRLGVLGRVHVSLATAGVVAFGLAAAVAVFYLVQESRLKQRRPVTSRGPALQTLDEINRRCVTLGFPVFTVALVIGAVWIPQVGARLRPEHSFALASWIAFAALVVARLTVGWRGRRAAWLTLVGFSSALIVLVMYAVRSRLGG